MATNPVLPSLGGEVFQFLVLTEMRYDFSEHTADWFEDMGIKPTLLEDTIYVDPATIRQMLPSVEHAGCSVLATSLGRYVVKASCEAIARILQNYGYRLERI